MLKNLLLPIFIALIFVTSCKKGANGPAKIANYKSLEFSASAATPLKVAVKIMRPATDGVSVDVQLVYISQSNITPPYRYSETNLQTGDHVKITVSTTKSRVITGTLVINGVSKVSTYAEVNAPDDLSTMEWDHYVD